MSLDEMLGRLYPHAVTLPARRSHRMSPLEVAIGTAIGIGLVTYVMARIWHYLAAYDLSDIHDVWDER